MPPGNDNLANAIEITTCGVGASAEITIDDATLESGEDALDPGVFYQTTWWKFTADADGTATFSTVGSRAGDADSGDGEPVGSFGYLDTVLAIYTGTGFGDFVQVGFNDDHGGSGLWSLLSIAVTAGTTYYVQVGTFFSGYTGTVVLDWDLPCGPAFVFPVHDYGDIGDCPAYVRYIRKGTRGYTFTLGAVTGEYGTVNLPAYDEGDLLVLIWSVNSDGTSISNSDASWTQLFAQPLAGIEEPPQTNTGEIACWYKIAESDGGGTDGPVLTPSTPVGSPAATDVSGGGYVLVFRCISTATGEAVAFSNPPIAASSPDAFTDGHLVLYDEPPPTETVTLDAPALDVGHIGNHWWGNLFHLVGGEVYLLPDPPPFSDVPDNMYQMPPSDPIAAGSDGAPPNLPGGSPNLHNGSFWNLTGTNYAYATLNPGPERVQSYDPHSITIGNSTHTFNPNPTDPESPTYHVVYPMEVITLAVIAPEAHLSDHNDFADALPITGCRIHLVDCNNGSTKQDGEPNHVGNVGGRSVWYRWQAVASGATTIDLGASNFDTLLAVYTGSSVGSLTEIVSSDDPSSVSFTATAGTVYYIAVDGYGGGFGQIDLVLEGACQTMVAYWGINATPIV